MVIQRTADRLGTAARSPEQFAALTRDFRCDDPGQRLARPLRPAGRERVAALVDRDWTEAGALRARRPASRWYASGGCPAASAQLRCSDQAPRAVSHRVRRTGPQWGLLTSSAAIAAAEAIVQDSARRRLLPVTPASAGTTPCTAALPCPNTPLSGSSEVHRTRCSTGCRAVQRALAERAQRCRNRSSRALRRPACFRSYMCRSASRSSSLAADAACSGPCPCAAAVLTPTEAVSLMV